MLLIVLMHSAQQLGMRTLDPPQSPMKVFHMLTLQFGVILIVHLDCATPQCSLGGGGGIFEYFCSTEKEERGAAAGGE